MLGPLGFFVLLGQAVAPGAPVTAAPTQSPPAPVAPPATTQSPPPAPVATAPAPTNAPEPSPATQTKPATTVQVEQTPPRGPVLGLQACERQALAHQAQIAQAVAQTAGAYARADQQFAGFLPAVNVNASYSRQTANYVPNPGSLPSGLGAQSPGTPMVAVNRPTRTPSWDTTGSYNLGITASQTVYDFGQTLGQYKAAKASAEAQKINEETIRQSVLFNVRSAFVNAWAQHALVDVQKDNLANQDRHLEQVQGQVRVGTRPEIDQAQVRADHANAQLQLINAQAAYETAKAQLNLAMGVDATTDYDVASEGIAELPEEAMEQDRAAALGAAQRPEMKNLAKQAEADQKNLNAVKGTYWPTLGVSSGFTERGLDTTSPVWNWNAQATMQWNLFQGGITNARVREAEANQAVTRSQTTVQRQQVRFDVINAQITVRTAKAALDTAKEVERNAREQLRLAEARYQAGAGSIIELQDAQVAATTASGQVVQADYNLSLARAELLKAVGRR